MTFSSATDPAETIDVLMADAGDKLAWDTYVTSHPAASHYHLFRWRRVIQSVFGRRTYYLLARDQSRVVGILPIVRLKSLIFGDFLVSMPYLNYGGVLADTPLVQKTLIQKCVQIAANAGVEHAELRHIQNDINLPVRTDKISMHLTLPQESDELWNKLGSKLRSQIKRPLRDGAENETGGIELVEHFYRIFAKKYRDLGVPVYPRRWFETILTEFPDDVHVHLVRLSGDPVAASIVVDFRDSAEVVWAASHRRADRLGANMFLYWSMLKHASDNGKKIFDFGRTSEGSGTYRFKAQWGAKPVQLYWHYWLKQGQEIPRLNLDNPKYEIAAAVWRKLPVWLTNVIGPALVKNLP